MRFQKNPDKCGRGGGGNFLFGQCYLVRQKAILRLTGNDKSTAGQAGPISKKPDLIFSKTAELDPWSFAIFVFCFLSCKQVS